jgi:cytochrome c oxidase subunit 3
MSTAAHGGHDDHHAPFLAHHFEDHGHQFDSGKLGIWAFLGQELLFFSGLFCAYVIYRGNHPEIFLQGSYFLDVKWGAVNTCVLIFSSLTAAWSVRCAQLNNQKGLILTIALTIACAFGFMGVKYVEYSHKIHDGLLPGKYFNPSAQALEKAGLKVPAVNIDGSIVAEPAPAASEGGEVVQDTREPVNRRLHIFFSVYFMMTGLHGIHVVAGILVYLWLLKRAIRGDFNSDYYGPIDFTALYWHLVDLVWIYLFPMLYLIH